MRDLPRERAKAIYRKRYWTRPNFDAVARLSAPIAAELFDTGVNMGPSVPSAWLQRWLNVLNRGGRDYRDMAIDGAIGPMTLSCLQTFLRIRSEEHTSELQSLMRISYAVFCLKKKKSQSN